MRIEHIAVWTGKLEEMRDFYCKYLGGSSNNGYHNSNKGFKSYFITFDNGARLELMSTVNMTDNTNIPPARGYAHMAFAVGDKDAVDRLTDVICTDGYTVIGEPRITGDGYYESIIADPDGNYVELCAE